MRETLRKHSQKESSVSEEDFATMQASGEGFETGKRVLELTSPPAMVSVPIFFVTTYYSDYALVPSKSRVRIIAAFLERGCHLQTRYGVSRYPIRFPQSPT